MDNNALLTSRSLTRAEHKLFDAACHEIPDGRTDRSEIEKIVRDGIIRVFGDAPFEEADWKRTEPILLRIGPRDARSNSEPYIVSLDRFRCECGYDLTASEPVDAYVKRHPRRTALARVCCFYPLAVISIAWQVARFGDGDVLLTSFAFHEHYCTGKKTLR